VKDAPAASFDTVIKASLKLVGISRIELNRPNGLDLKVYLNGHKKQVEEH
jgi:hypothetical protein